ncbi:hypothetical protein ACI799_20835 [Blastococcus sp. SYSU DS0753]
MPAEDGTPGSARTRTPALVELLDPYIDRDLPGQLLDVPPQIAVAALGLLDRELGTARPNGVQPPMQWLVAQAAALGGRLNGGLVRERAFLRLDGIQVPAGVARELAARTAGAWPAHGASPSALEAAVAEGWVSWTARDHAWVGVGTELHTAPWPGEVAVVGLWWD